MSRAGEIIVNTGTCIVDLLRLETLSWSEHLARMGTREKPQHLLKAVVVHRNLAWWRKQQVYNKIQQSHIFYRA